MLGELRRRACPQAVPRLWRSSLELNFRPAASALAFPWHGEGASVCAAMGTPVELRVGGQTYRVLASAEESELRRLADIVDARLRSMTAPGRQVSPQTLVLAAISLVHDLEEERRARKQVEARSREMLSTVLARIDAALEADAGERAPTPSSALQLPEALHPDL